jgi:hypothetical protein
MAKIYDFFQFSGENEILEIRLHELSDVVDYFVIGSCQYSHSGIYKGLNNIPPFLQERFGDKIIFIEIPYVPHPNPWYNEHLGRQYIFEQVKNRIAPEDRILCCDLDEIPKADILKKESINLDIEKRLITFAGDYYYFCFDLWGRKSIDGFLTKMEWINGVDLNFLRSHRTNFQHNNLFKIVPDSSWHFSTVGVPKQILNKMTYFGHANECPKDCLNLDWIRQCIKEKRGSISKQSNENELQLVSLENHPKYLIKNQNKFNYLFYSNYIE